MFTNEIPEELKGYFQRLISMSKIPEQFREIASKCLLELLMQPENFALKETTEDEKIITRFYKFSLNKLPNQFLQNNLKMKAVAKKREQKKMWDFQFKSKREIFYLLTRLHKLEQKRESDLKHLRNPQTNEPAEDEEPILELFDEERVSILATGNANIVHEIRRIMEQTDKFMETPHEENESNLEAEIHRLNFGGMPVQPNCLGQPVKEDFGFWMGRFPQISEFFLQFLWGWFSGKRVRK